MYLIGKSRTRLSIHHSRGTVMNKPLLFVVFLCFWAVGRTTASAALLPFGVLDDEQTSIVYNRETGEVAVDAPRGRELGGISIDSGAGILITEQVCSVAQELGIRLGGEFIRCPVEDIFKPPSFPRFGSISFGNLAQPGLSADFLLNDLTVVGSLAGGGDLGSVDLIYVPEPSTVVLFVLGLSVYSLRRRSH